MTETFEQAGLPHSRYSHVYAVVRWDSGSEDPKDQVSITKVFRSAEMARKEVYRVSELNSDKGCSYFVVQTRFVEEP